MPRFVWTNAFTHAVIFEAENEEEAYERVIAFRMRTAPEVSREDCEAWYMKNDQIIEIDEDTEI